MPNGLAAISKASGLFAPVSGPSGFGIDVNMFAMWSSTQGLFGGIRSAIALRIIRLYGLRDVDGFD